MIKEMVRLEKRIQQLKRELVHKVEVTGINSDETLNCSQQLDKLIFTYQKFNLNKIAN